MRNVSVQNREIFFFPYLFQFQSNNYAIFYNAIYVHAKCSTRRRMCQSSLTDKKKNTRTKVTYLLRAQ